MRRGFPVALGFGFLIVTPALVAGYLLQVNRSYDKLLEKYECDQSVCEADFDGDGIKGTLSIDRAAPRPEFDSWFVVRDSGKELLRLPRRSIDNSLRTHAALLPEKGRARLIIYDHIYDSAGPRTLVLGFDGEKMQQVLATKKDYQLLAAIRARDETGTLEGWSIFQLVVWPTLFCYYLVVFVVIWRVLRKRNNPKPPPLSSSLDSIGV